MNKDNIRQWVNLLMLIVTIGVNGLANAVPINGQTTGEISDRFKVYFVPAGYVFSIWGLIYLALFGFIVYQLLPSQRENSRLRSIGYWFALSCLANSAWILLWHYEFFPLTLVVMLALLACLIVIYLRLEVGLSQATNIERLFVEIPFSIYLGWVTVATIANVTSLLDYLNWNGWGITPEIWAVIMLSVGVVIAAGMSQTRRDIPYLLVIIWAYVGIAVKHSNTPLVATAAWITTGLVVLLLAVTGMLNRPVNFHWNL